MLSAKNRFSKSILFDLEQNFGGDLKSYQQIVKEKILKAKEYDITIVGLTTDNLPVQIQAVSHESKDSIQNIFPNMNSIIHFRCSSHLLDLSYKYWLASKILYKI